MDPVSALGLASNVAQFVQIAYSLIKTTADIQQSTTGAKEETLTLDLVYSKLSNLNKKLASCPDDGFQPEPKHTAPNDQDIIEAACGIAELSRACQNDCEKLLTVVGKLKGRGRSPSRLQSFRLALKSIWKQNEIDALERQVGRTQATLTLHICVVSKSVVRLYSF